MNNEFKKTDHAELSGQELEKPEQTELSDKQLDSVTGSAKKPYKRPYNYQSRSSRSNIT